MKPILTGVVFLLSVSVVVGGNIYWHHKINTAAKEAKVILAKTSTTLTPDSTNHQTSQTHSQSSQKTENNTVDIKTLTMNLPTALQADLLDHYQKHTSFTLLLSGGKEITTLAKQLEVQLNKAYGDNFFKISEANMGDRTSLDVYHQNFLSPYLKDHPDAILYTPPFLNDRGVVNVRDSLDVIRLLKENVSRQSPSTLFMVQPPNPVIGLTPIEEDLTKLDQFMANQDIIYINHMKAWPRNQSDLKQDLNTTGRLPNEKGDNLWANTLTNYFTSQRNE